MDDKKVFELKRLELAYDKQLIFIRGLIIIALIGLIIYIYNIYNYNFQLLLVSIVLIVTGAVGMFTVDKKIKEISKKIKSL